MKTPIGRTVAMSRLASDATVVDDLTAGRRLGEVQGDLTPFLIDYDGEPYIVFAGEIIGGDKARLVFIDLPRDQLMCPVLRGAEAARTPHDGVWMSFPEPFEPGIESPPLTADRLDPMFGPGWVRYAPLND
jgi:hypothetical protein